jgi:hypothetical protein
MTLIYEKKIGVVRDTLSDEIKMEKNISIANGKNIFTFANGTFRHFKFNAFVLLNFNSWSHFSFFLLTYGNFLLQCSNCQSLRAELSCSLKATFLQHNWPIFF